MALLMYDDPQQRVSFEVLFVDTVTRRAALMFVPGNVGILVESRNRMDALETLDLGHARFYPALVGGTKVPRS